jgi:acylphosphatase
VRNLSDGRVELVAEGDGVEINRFLHAVQDEMGEFIRGIETHQEQPDHSALTGFTVRA